MFYKHRYYIAANHAEEMDSLSYVSRTARLFRYVLEEMPLLLDGNDILAGRYGSDAEPVELPQKILTKNDVMNRIFSPEDKKIRNVMRDSYGCKGSFGKAHTCIDYGYVLRNGLNEYIRRVDARLSELCNDKEREFLNAMREMLCAAEIFSKRFAALALEYAQNTDDPAKKAHFERMHRALCRVPMEPARDFYEAIQCVWLMHSLVPISEHAWYSISLGRLDQYLYPYYAAADETEKTRIPEYIAALFRLLDSYGDGACALNLGGLDENDNDMTNELSRVIVEVEKQVRLRSPIIAVRISEKTPDDFFESLIDEKLFSMGQPTFYSERACRRAMEKRGLSHKEAVGYSVNSCMGLYKAGEEVADMWGVMLNMHLPLELAVNGGKPFAGELPMTLSTKAGVPDTFDELLALYKQYFSELTALCVRLNNMDTRVRAEGDPNPFLAALTEGCIDAAADCAVGCRYRTVTVETMGLTNAADALGAVKELVYDKKKYTLNELIEAARCDYVGYDDLLCDIKACPKYGCNIESADSLVTLLFDMAADELKKYNGGNTYYCPSLHTIDVNVSYGAPLGAFLDGRRAGAPVNKNAGPSNDVRKLDPTSLIMSAGKQPQYRFDGGQPIDIRFEPSAVREHSDKIRALIMTYGSLGGLQLHVNSVDAATLRAAHASPEDYSDLIVRVGGFSQYFCDLPAESRLEFIERFEREA